MLSYKFNCGGVKFAGHFRVKVFTIEGYTDFRVP